MPGIKALLEFAHPALAITGFAFWGGFTLTHNKIMADIALGILLVVIAAGLTWFTGNARAAKRDPEQGPAFMPRLVLLHGACAALIVVLSVLVVTGA